MYALELVGEDDSFATYEAASLATRVRVAAPGIAIADTISPHIAQLAWTRTVSDVVCQTTSQLTAMQEELAVAALEDRGTAAVRARGIRETDIDTVEVERTLGRVLDDRGFSIDLEHPEYTLRVLVSEDTAIMGWVIVEPGGDVGRRRPTDRRFFQPGSMSPRLARSLINIAGIRPETMMLDPMCGTGGIVLEAARVGAEAIGMDVQDRMVRGTLENWEDIDGSGSVSVVRGDASCSPLVSNSLDAIVFDVPYGRQSKITGTALIDRALTEAHRVAASAVVVADRPLQEAATEAGWTINATFEKRVHRSLTRYIAHLVR